MEGMWANVFSERPEAVKCSNFLLAAFSLNVVNFALKP